MEILKNPQTLPYAITSKSGAYKKFRPIWKVCTFLVRSYEQKNKKPGAGAGFDLNSGAGMPKNMHIFWEQEQKLPISISIS